MRWASFVLVSAVSTGCGNEPTPTAAPPPPGMLVTVTPADTRGAAAPPGAPPPGAATTADATVLREIVARVPSALPPPSPSGTRVGTPTGLPGEEAPRPETDDDGAMVAIMPDLVASNAGSERDLRGTLYWDLVQQCRAPNGEILPAEAVTLSFRVDARGEIDRASVMTEASSLDLEDAARCMLRVVRTSEARFTPPRLERPIKIRTKVPSVD